MVILGMRIPLESDFISSIEEECGAELSLVMDTWEWRVGITIIETNNSTDSFFIIQFSLVNASKGNKSLESYYILTIYSR